MSFGRGVKMWYNRGNITQRLRLKRRSIILIGAEMTENQRNYLADLAGKKGVILSGTDNWSVAKASSEIERLNELPDAAFDELTDDQNKQINKLTNAALVELNKWGFTRRAQ